MMTTYQEFLAELTDGRHRVDSLCNTFEECYGTRPTVAVSAPGRAEIIGNHTDHNNGRVVAAAITQDTVIVAGAVAPEGDDPASLQLHSEGWERDFVVGPGEPGHDTERLMLGVREGLRNSGLAAPGYRACMTSSVLPGSGLSSSAALEIALAGVHGALTGETGEDIPPLRAALVGRFAENHYMNKPSGLMDQLASALGGIHAIDFRDPEAPLTHRIEIDFSETNHKLMVVNTGGSHADLTDAYAAVSREMLSVARELGVSTLAETSRKELFRNLSAVRAATGDRAVMRALHFFEEQDRVSAFVDAADSRSDHEILALMRESGDSSIRLLQNVHTGSARDQSLALGLELTRTYLRQRGGTGAYRVHGGGFAGTMLVVMPEDLFPEYRTAMQRAFGDHAVVPLSIRPRGL
ncbi:MAG: galactokinase, partial [Spirochaetaceae bacterium]